MRFKPTRIVASIAVIGAVAAGGAAFTASTDQPTTQALGYGVTSVTGGDITGISYQLSADGTTIDTVTLTTGEDLTQANNGSPASVYLAFNSDGFGSGGDATCTVQSATTVSCSVTNGETVANTTAVHIAITNGSGNGDSFASS